jgi:cob(I)alamin adenosyltransferase
LLENEIDRLNERLPKLKDFILPGGSVLSAQTQITRCICRRVERHVVGLNDPKYNLIISYLNRLSDYLFVLSREYLRLENIEEVKWKKD